MAFGFFFGLLDSMFREENPWIIGEALRTFVGHNETLGNHNTVRVKPDSWDAMEGHAFFQRCLVAGSNAGRELSPCRWKTDADRITKAAILFDPIFCDCHLPRRGKLVASYAGRHLIKYRIQALSDNICHSIHTFGRFTEVDAARKRRVISVTHATHLDVEDVAGDERGVCPRQMGR